jgi:hypothetical protein
MTIACNSCEDATVYEKNLLGLPISRTQEDEKR